ncbi:hypothetical protein DFH07DRAFT_761052, partial [Mycena maculata]
VIVIIIVVIALVEVYHDQIINALKPVTNWLHGLRGGWLIPIVVIIALSFPPLFGQDIVAMLCGLVWGLGWFPTLTFSGTILGEMCTYFFFKFCCGARGERLELSNMQYGFLAHVVREGGLKITIVNRYSTIPPHFTTAVFSTCGLPFWKFLIAAVVSLPKQLVIVFIGVSLDDGGFCDSINKVQKIVLAVTIVVTVLAFIYIRRLMMAARPGVVYSQRKARQAKLQGAV